VLFSGFPVNLFVFNKIYILQVIDIYSKKIYKTLIEKNYQTKSPSLQERRTIKKAQKIKTNFD